ncbi:hypothetical protein JAAARDRAFT_239731 [Jaapia argillacea MUCL 33604]|uniref:RRM domain-containing protein n=1 Tax=Jaapia argillacea MUCL 33604 TaxID=933084 RepID=A0A067QMT1_9AGAM|nr:hypothetical protein JAAARDRAFT_239731 [Jaapia argillacea MUCL 33604]
MTSSRLYLRGLPQFVGRDEVIKYLSSYGKILEVKILNGYGFVQFDSEKDAMDVLDTFSSQPFFGANVTVEYARPQRRRESFETETDRSSSPPSRARLAPSHAQLRYPVVINNLPKRICWQELKDFGRLAGGLVAFCDVDKTRRGRGFIEYLSQADADAAIKHLDGKELQGNTVRVSEYESVGSLPKHSRSRSRSPPRSTRSVHERPRRRNSNTGRESSDPGHASTSRRKSSSSINWNDARTITGAQQDYMQQKYEREWERTRQQWLAPDYDRRACD